MLHFSELVQGFIKPGAPEPASPRVKINKALLPPERAPSWGVLQLIKPVKEACGAQGSAPKT